MPSKRSTGKAKPDAEVPPPAEEFREIDLSNIAPLEYLKIRLPKSGGLRILRGRNGIGKSRALAAVNKMITGQGEVSITDGADQGEAEGLGILMKLGNKVTRSGELEVLSLEGRFSVLDLVDPGIADPAAADNRRIKALLQLSGVKPEASMFHKLVGGKAKFNEMISAGAVATNDIVVMAAKIKRDLEARARVEEDTATKERATAKANKESVGEINLAAPSDREVLSAALEAAVREEEKLKTQSENALEADQRATNARRAMAQAKENYKGPTVEAAEKAVSHASSQVMDQEKLIAGLEEELRKAREELRSRSEWLVSQTTARDTAVEHEAAIEASRQAIAEASKVADVPEEKLQAATAAVTAAREAVELGALVRRAQESLQKAETATAAAREAEKEATRLRDAAKGVDTVLSKAVQSLGCPLRVSGGRLVTDTDRGEELFSDLSRGEQWKLALDIAIDAVGERGILVIDQSGFEGLDDFNRKLIDQHLQGTGVVMLTAEKSNDEEIVVEAYEQPKT